MPILRARQQIACKLEATAGTAEVLAAANVIMHTGDAEWEPEFAMTQREAMTASLSPRGSVVGTQQAKIRFKMYLRGTSAAATSPATESDFAVPLKMCGANVAYSGGNPNEIATYTPSSTTIVDETTGAYGTVALYMDGKVYKIHGAVGNCVLTFTVGAPILAEFEFTGVYNAPTDLALLVPSYPSVIEPAFLGATVSLVGTYLVSKISSLKFDFGNTVIMRPNPASTAGFFTAQITARNPKGSLDPEEVLAATNNFFTQWSAGTPGIITTGTIGSTNYNSLIFNVPAAAYTKVGLGNRDGMANAACEFEARASAAAGDDEWNLVTT